MLIIQIILCAIISQKTINFDSI